MTITQASFDPPFEAWLRDRRLEADLTQIELAERVGSHSPQISSFERGGRLPPWAMAQKIAHELNVTETEMAVRLVVAHLLRCEEGRIFLDELGDGLFTWSEAAGNEAAG